MNLFLLRINLLVQLGADPLYYDLPVPLLDEITISFLLAQITYDAFLQLTTILLLSDAVERADMIHGI